MVEKQKTLAGSSEYSGIALHTGGRSTLRMHPASENFGIVFRRVDVPGKPEVAALASNVVDVRRGTTIQSGNAAVATVEHVMASLHAYGIDNALVDMDGMEPPIADGSALPFLEMIERAGVKEQDAPAKIFVCDRLFHVDGGNTQIFMAPDEEFKVTCTTSFPGCPIDPQFYSGAISAESFKKEIAGGRTFASYSEIRQLMTMGLARGGSLDNAAIIHDGAIICKEALRYPNEIVRHKILDIVGDIYLCGRRVRGHIVAVKPGHPKNVELAGMIQKYISEK